MDLDHFSAVVDHVQHQSAAAVAPLTDRPRPLTTSSTGQKTLSDLAATSYGSEDHGDLSSVSVQHESAAVVMHLDRPGMTVINKVTCLNDHG